MVGVGLPGVLGPEGNALSPYVGLLIPPLPSLPGAIAYMFLTECFVIFLGHLCCDDLRDFQRSLPLSRILII